VPRTEPCDFPWCQEPALVGPHGEAMRFNGIRVCKRDAQLWLDLYHIDATKGLYEETDDRS